ncbi:MAG: hypothetical protein B6D46_09125 [Polyangiaceae bacterium UTPRO1]|jgi:hypothetical protein|nr:hypothetical protein [Myxococcales bacterium]OQY66886.1 MAG: hypothetical protein B6D46_09125 [Polyangiaceae bacterium UTPRO1]
MLTRLDDYPLHQTAEPIAQPATGDRNFYDRYFFNGYTRAGDLFFAAALGVYPNRRVMDAAFSVVRDGRQWVVRGSRLAPIERTETTVGPITVEVVEPLRTLRVRVAENAHGLAADLVFRARTAAIEEPRFTHRVAGRLVMDSTRLTQFGTWEGRLTVGDASVALAPAAVLGCRDRSWGVRLVGEPEGGAPGMPPQFYWLWAPINFDDVCVHFDVNEDGEGRRWHANGNLARVGDFTEGGVEYLQAVAQQVRWRPGTRRARAAKIVLTPHRRPPLTLELEPLFAFQMRGLGYLDPEWGHGMWKGEEAVGGDVWTLADLDPLDPRHVHVQQLCRARLDGREGLGVLEQLVLGPHAPSGFRSILDGAP